MGCRRGSARQKRSNHVGLGPWAGIPLQGIGMGLNNDVVIAMLVLRRAMKATCAADATAFFDTAMRHQGAVGGGTGAAGVVAAVDGDDDALSAVAADDAAATAGIGGGGTAPAPAPAPALALAPAPAPAPAPIAPLGTVSGTSPLQNSSSCWRGNRAHSNTVSGNDTRHSHDDTTRAFALPGQ